MTLPPVLRKLLLTLHLLVSVGWLGAVLAYLALALTVLGGAPEAMARAAALSLGVLARLVLVPCAVAALVTGVVQALVTPWGLLRHTWVVAKLVLTVVATAVLLGHLRAIGQMTALAADGARALSDAGMLRTQLVVHAAGGLVVLLVITVISGFKPWGRTPWARRAP